jgi:phosphoglycerate kinase
MDLSSIWRLRRLDVAGRRVFLRVDLDGPRSPYGAVLDDLPLRVLLPGLRGLQKANAKVIVAASFATDPDAVRAGDGVAARLGELLGCKVGMLSPRFEPELRFLEPGQVVLTPNLASIAEEGADDPAWATDVASVVDVYVLDGLRAASARVASTDALPRLLVARAVGPIVAAALDIHRDAVEAPAAPYALVVGGYSMRRVAPLIRALLPQCNALLLGGGVANTFLAARGWQPGGSAYEVDGVTEARSILEAARAGGVEVKLPVDAVVRTKPAGGGKPSYDVLPIDRAFRSEEAVVDVAVATCAAYQAALAKAVSGLWVGLMGECSIEETQGGTLRVAQAMTSPHRAMAAGDEAVWAATYFGFDGRLRLAHGGDAALALLAGETLPGLDAIGR